MCTPMEKYRQLAARVSELRPILERGENASGYLALFDEFVRESSAAEPLTLPPYSASHASQKLQCFSLHRLPPGLGVTTPAHGFLVARVDGDGVGRSASETR